jgi:transcriptional regulator with XRE-family HTH domain
MLDGRAVGARVRELRKTLGISQRKLVMRSGVSPAYVAKLEGGQIPSPGLDALSKIAAALGHPLTDLIAPPGEALEEEHSEFLVPVFGHRYSQDDIYRLISYVDELRIEDAVTLIGEWASLNEPEQRIVAGVIRAIATGQEERNEKRG